MEEISPLDETSNGTHPMPCLEMHNRVMELGLHVTVTPHAPHPRMQHQQAEDFT